MTRNYALITVIMRIFVLTANYELRVSRKSHLSDHSIQGTESLDKYFFMTHKVKTVLFVYVLLGLNIFLSLLLRKSNAKFLLPSLKTLTNFKNPSLFKELIAAFRNPPVTENLLHNPAVILKIVP
jgi:hypothetical protein